MIFKLLVACSLIIAVLSDAPAGGSQLCEDVLQKDCTTFSDEIVCGSDGHTYMNSCEFAKGICTHNGHSLHATHDGPCA